MFARAEQREQDDGAHLSLLCSHATFSVRFAHESYRESRAQMRESFEILCTRGSEEQSHLSHELNSDKCHLEYK